MRNSRKLSMLHRSLIAVAFGSVLGLGTAAAGDTPAKTFATVLKLKNSDGATESLRFDGALAVGESRGYETDAGTPVLVTRTEAGLTIELPSRTVNIALPEHDAAEGEAAGANVEKIVRIQRREGDPAESRMVVLHGDSEAVADAEAHIDEAIDGDSLALHEMEEGDGENVRKVVIMRKRHDGEAAED